MRVGAGWGRGRQTVDALFGVLPSHNESVCGINPLMKHNNDLYLSAGTAPTNRRWEVDLIKLVSVVHTGVCL